jgi:tripartite-type tricarboxylate transporter receptor subunit TctC
MRRVILGALLTLAVFGGDVFADNFPSHPIAFVVPFSAGGPTDAMARILGDHIRSTLGQPILIENVTGAGGSGAWCARHPMATPSASAISAPMLPTAPSTSSAMIS